MVSLTVTAVLVAVGVAAISYMMPNVSGESPAVGAHTAPAAAAPDASQQAKALEVTGFRFVAQPDKAVEIRYLVVNHASAPLSEMTVSVSLYSSNSGAPGSRLARFRLRVPKLGPYESQEMASQIENSGAVPLPDWRDVVVAVDAAE